MCNGIALQSAASFKSIYAGPVLWQNRSQLGCPPSRDEPQSRCSVALYLVSPSGCGPPSQLASDRKLGVRSKEATALTRASGVVALITATGV